MKVTARPTVSATRNTREGEHAGFSGKTFALQLLNFGVLLFL